MLRQANLTYTSTRYTPTCSHLVSSRGRTWGARKRHAIVAPRAYAHPYPNTPEDTPQEELLRQTALRSVWTSRLASAAVALGRLLRSGLSFLRSCGDVLPHFAVLSPGQAAQRMVLILAASLFMVVAITTIDSALLYTYVRAVRRMA